MTAVLTPVNRFADRNLSAQPVDNSGEKLGEPADNRCRAGENVRTIG